MDEETRIESVEELSSLWHKFKNQEAKANQKRLDIEKELEKLLPGLPKEGSKTYKDFPGWKIKAKTGFKYNLNQEEYLLIVDEIPPAFRIHKTKLEVDKKKYENFLKYESNPETLQQVQECIELKPAKTSFEIEKIK